jgi:two-component system response regulator DevR
MASRAPAERVEKVTALEPHKRPLGVILVDPLPVMRAGLSMLIEDRPDLQVIAEAGTAEETLLALGRIRRTSVVVLVGMNLEGEHDSYWLIRAIRERFPAIAILACGARSDPMAISRALFLGADGYVDKHLDPPAFLETLRQASDGEMVLAGTPGDWMGSIADGLEHRREIETRLTEREREVLAVAAEGLTAREMASRLGVRERTVTTHLGRIYGKLGVGTRVAAIRVAAQNGLVSVGAAD